MKLAAITDRLVGQPMFALAARARELESHGKHVLHFEIGDLGFPSPASAIEGAQRALDRGETHYTDSSGLPEFRQAIAEYASGTHHFTPRLDQVLVAPANAVIDYVVRCVANVGDEVIIPDPGFPTYSSVLQYAGIGAVPVTLSQESGFRLTAEDLLAKMSPRTKLIIINSPNNPTGACIDKAEMLRIAQLAVERDIFLLSDEVYARTVYRGAHVSAAVADHCTTHTIVLGSLSKSHAMAGWRLGYAIGPEHLIAKMALLQQTILSCLPAFTQRGGIAALRETDQFTGGLMDELRKRRDALVQGLNQIPGIACAYPEATFYLFFKVSGLGLSDDAYARALLEEEGVCLLPGHFFGRGGSGFMRLSYGAATLATIGDALARMTRFHLRRRPAAARFARNTDHPTSINY